MSTETLPVPEGAPLSGFEDATTRNAILVSHHLKQTKSASLTPLLPLLSLKGKPYTLTNHFPFEPFFKTMMPRTIIYKTGRQVSKSTSLAAQGIILSNTIPYFSTLYVTPLFEMIRRFSHNYVREFIETSPIKALFMGQRTTNQILQRSFRNGSNMYFSYAFLDAERTRGIPADRNVIDEVQDMNYDFLQIIHETVDGSPNPQITYAGTPKSLENTIARLFADSSQAEWIIKCQEGGCGHWNIPTVDYDLMDMIGPWHRDISEKCPAVVCAKCRKPLQPRTGFWQHAFPERRGEFVGYHVPQIIMPMHYASPEKWDILLGKQRGRNNTTQTTFLNEVCGESWDEGSKLVTVTDLRAAAVLPWKNVADEAVAHLDSYTHRILAVDWGGGGGRLANTRTKDSDVKRLRTSYTTLAVLGRRPDGKIHCIWGHRSLRTHDFEYEARLCIEVLAKFGCSHLVHDYGGAGGLRTALIAQAGFPSERIIHIAYHPTARKNIMVLHPARDDHPLDWYTVDKARSLQLTCQCIKNGLIQFFTYDYRSADEPGLMHDFLALIEEKVDARIGTDVYVIVRSPTMPDDFAQAVNIGSCAIWYMTESWPDLASAAHLWIKPEVLSRLLHPMSNIDWADM